MLGYVVKRILSAIPTLFVLVALAFFMMRMAPGGPFDTDRILSPDIQANLERAYHLDEPLIQQFARYLGNLLQGDFGPSFQYKDQTVSDLIALGFPVSLTLGLAAMVIAIVFGVTLGSVAALKQNKVQDHLLMSLAMVGISIPNFVVAPVLVLVFAIYFDWLPAGGLGGSTLQLQNMVLPIIALSLPQIAYIARLTRASMIEVLNSNFIKTARAKGLSERRVVLVHALKPSLLPVVSYLGPATAGILTGSVVIEQIFGIPGLGRYFVQGALNRDYTLVLGVVIFFGCLIILFNLLVDLVYAWLDPKIRQS
ncbi:MAG: oligopeptide ABC transporter permease OppB [Pseudomonadota bacterium]